MFNKTETFIRKTRLTNESSKKFRKILSIKKHPINLKSSFENSNKYDYSSENNSNLNIKTAAQSKMASESSSLRPTQTQPNNKIKKSFFYEEKNKIQSLHSKKEKYFSQKNNKSNIKHEITQYEPQIIFSYINEYNNIIKNNKQIDRMAKKLVLKLNEEEYYDKDKTFKNYWGNKIILKNGFFNGVNLVMNNIDDEKNQTQFINKTQINKMNFTSSKKNSILLNNLSNNNPNKTQRNFNSNTHSNLPLFLRDKAHIQGTEILSPFCKEARDEFLFNKIFNSGLRRKIPKRFDLIDNKLNIFYAENEYQYNSILKKYNHKCKLQGKKIEHEVGPTKDQIKLNKIKSTLGFIKKIFDYSYPNMVLSKVRKSEKLYDKRANTEKNIPPFKRAELLAKKRNDIIEKYLKMSIDVQNSNYE